MLELSYLLDEEFELAPFFEGLEEGDPELDLIDTDLVFFHVRVYFEFVAALRGVLHEFVIGLRVCEGGGASMDVIDGWEEGHDLK